ncbi:hypothetical protein QFC19_000589 [Naganishia cerealis]|uniref:Uncharacterized protein n=1 Tax=Naganishia cerealis TaxID=610337 RepID=A0ACC2WNC8_9TREE|nr:hypothetical protein QFC19_000589 [Naganishia cerealis]
MGERREDAAGQPSERVPEPAFQTSNGPTVTDGKHVVPSSTSTPSLHEVSIPTPETVWQHPYHSDTPSTTSTDMSAVDNRVQSLGTSDFKAIRITGKSNNQSVDNSQTQAGKYALHSPVDSNQQHSNPALGCDTTQRHDALPDESEAAREGRLKAIQDLCLDVSDLPLRRETFIEYTELVKRVFRTTTGMVSIIQQDVYMILDKGPPRIADLDMSICPRLLHDSPQEGIVVHDISQSEMRQSLIWDLLADHPIKFYAGAPLIVKLPNSSPAVIGTLCVLDDKPRPDFIGESQQILAQLASMLVRSICAEQSELNAQRAAKMHAATFHFLQQAIMPDPASANTRGHSDDRATSSSPTAERATGRYREEKAWDNQEVTARSLLVEPEDENQTEDNINNSMYAILSICEILDDSAVVLLDTSGYRIFLRRPSESNGRILEHVTENVGSKGFLNSDIGNRLTRLIRESVRDEDIVVKKIERLEEERTAIPSEVIGFRLADVAFESPFHLDASESSEFTDGICDILGKALKLSPLWLNRSDRDPQSIAIFKRIAPRAECMLVHPLWNPDGSPLKLLLIAWRNQTPRKQEIEAFTASLMTGLAAALTLHKARGMEMAQITFGNVQAHELRTPIHQIQNLASVLKSSLTDNNTVHKLEFEEGLENIENASIQLEAVIRNILSYFELESDFSPAKVRWEAFGLEKQAPRSLEATLNDIVTSLITRDIKHRANNAERASDIEVVLEIVPPFLGDTIQEDISGNFARAIGNIMQNALSYIEDAEGYVFILVDDVPSLLPPQGFSDISTTKNVSIKIQDSGIGMNGDYLKYHYFRPLKKGNECRAGSGLSVHIARRLLNSLGGSIAVSSQAGKGTTVHIEVPLSKRQSQTVITAQSDTSNADPETIRILDIGTPRNVHLLGFFEEDCMEGVRCAGQVLIRSIERLGCKGVKSIEGADLVFFNTGKQSVRDIQKALKSYRQRQVVFLFKEEQSRLDFDTSGFDFDISRQRRPLLPSTLRMLLFQANEAHQSAGEKPPRDLKATTECQPADSSSAAIAKRKGEIALPAVTTNPGIQGDLALQDASKSNKMQVIVVEDNRIVSNCLISPTRHVESIEASNGEEAVQIFRDQQEPCIVTALNGDEHRDRGLRECGMDAWLVKPTNRKQIVEAVEQGMKAVSMAA